MKRQGFVNFSHLNQTFNDLVLPLVESIFSDSQEGETGYVMIYQILMKKGIYQ